MKHRRTLPRKRIRGLRRHSRNHRRRAAIPQELDVNMLEKWHYDSEDLGLSPWNVHGKPTLAIRKLWANRLLTDFQRWQAQLAELYPDAYLAVYLYEPRFGKSMLFATIADQRIYYKHRPVEDIPLPPEYQSLPGADKLHWTAHKELDIMTPEDFTQFRSWYLKKPHWETEDINGEPIFIVQTGWVWVGQAAT